MINRRKYHDVVQNILLLAISRDETKFFKAIYKFYLKVSCIC